MSLIKAVNSLYIKTDARKPEFTDKKYKLRQRANDVSTGKRYVILDLETGANNTINEREYLH